MKNNVLLALKSHGRFCGEAPPIERSHLAWVYWWMRMLGYHLPVRLAILPGEMPEHDWHHRHPHDLDWANGIYARQRDLEAGLSEPYTDIWGLFEAIDRVFETLSKAPTLTDE